MNRTVPAGPVLHVVPEVSLMHRVGYPFGSTTTMLHGGIGLVFGGYARD